MPLESHGETLKERCLSGLQWCASWSPE